MKIAVIGAGITGLSLANILSKHKVNVTVFEKEKIGGKIQTIYFQNGNKNYFIELGPDAIVFDKKKLEKIEKFFPHLFNHKRIVNSNPIYIYSKNRISIIPTNFIEFITTDLLDNKQKFNFFIRFVLNFLKSKFSDKIFNSQDIDLSTTLKEYSIKKFGIHFHNEVIDPLMSTVFGISSDRLILKYVYPIIKKFENNLFYKPLIMFNLENGLYSLIDKLKVNIEIKKQKVGKILLTEKGFFIDDFYFDKIVLTGKNYEIVNLLENLQIETKLQAKIDLQSIISKVIGELKKINYHSSLVNVFVLKKKINLKANGIIFKNCSVKSITFFTKKWYHDYDIEIIRVFSEYVENSFIIKELNEFFKNLQYDFDSSIVDNFWVFWDKELVDYDANYLKISLCIKDLLKSLEKFGIFVFGNFVGGTSILDRLVFSIDNFYKILTND